MEAFNSNYRDFCNSLPEDFEIFLKVANKLKEAEILETQEKIWNPEFKHYSIYNKKALTKFFVTFFHNVPNKVIWEDKNTKMISKGKNESISNKNTEFTLKISGVFEIYSAITKEEYIVEFSLIATLTQRGIFG